MPDITKNIRQAKVLHVANTTSAWANIDTVISRGLLCIEFTADNKTKAKVGDGVGTYAELPYLSDGTIDITNYYTSTETDTAITNAISALGNFIRIKGIVADVESLPSSNNEIGDLYFVGTFDPTSETNDSFEEYVYTANDTFEYVGKLQTEIDLSDYVTTEDLEDVEDRIDALENDTHTHSNQQILDNTTASYTTAEQTKLANIEAEANKTIVDSELSTTSTNPVQNSVITSALGDKVDKVTGKQLSTEDYTTAEKTKLAGLENYDDTALANRVSAIEEDYLRESDYLIINCIL